jgi:Tfp pilus assembly protein PilX
MNMKTRFTIQKPNQTGSALILVMIMSAIALAILAGMMTWAATSTRLTHRSIQYTRSVAAAEAATEKVESQITRDFLSGGEPLVSQNLDIYRRNTVPSSSDSSYWNTWEFNDASGNTGQTYVQRVPGTSYNVLDAPYTGLKGYVSTYTVVSHARDTASIQDVTAGVLQQLQLTGIPIFQFGMYSSGNMEISCGQPFDVTGHVHSNGKLYVEPDSFLTFESGVTAVDGIFFHRDPLDSRGTPPGTPAGGVVYAQTNQVDPHVQALTLPIGTNNTPEAIRGIIEPPPPGELSTSPIGLLRYYNLCDMRLIVSDTGVIATSGRFNNFSTQITNSEVALFVSTNNSFWDAREGKTVQPIDINIGSLTTWSQTNSNLRPVLIAANLSSTYVMNSIYVVDNRTPSTRLGAVRVFNGTNLPPNGLTVATGRPLYVWGDYNDTANLGTANTTATRPASLVADAITILSDAWRDNYGNSLHNATATTVNAALLTGVVETTLGQYSGGMENFPRFLESWGPIIFTYNGSMVKMFPSLYATNVWCGINYSKTYYKPPVRKWAYDANFDNQLKLPPHTPQLQKVIRSQWATVPPGTNAVATTP